MSISPSSSSGSWQPTLSSSLQKQLSNMENSQYVGSKVQQAAGSLYTQAVQESLPLIAEKGKLQSQVSSLQKLQTALQGLQTAIEKLGSQSTWNSVTGASSNTSALTVDASSGAPETSISFNVTKLAQGQISTIDQLTALNATSSAASSNDTLTIQGGLGTKNISIQSGDSLNTIAENINNESNSTGVQASVVPVQTSTGTTQYQIMLSSTQIGATKGSFSISSTNGLTETNVQQAQDAKMTLGNSSPVTITSSTNTFKDALPNTTLNVSSTGTGTISIKSDPQAVTNAMNKFFNAYNAVEKLVYNGGNASDTTAGQLIAGELPTAIGAQASTDSKYTSLSQIGAMLSPGDYSMSNGKFSSSSPPSLGWQQSSGMSGLSLPSSVSLQKGSTTFSDAVQNNPADLQKFLGVSSSGLNLPTGSFLQQLSSQIKGWLNDLGGTSVNGTQVTGEISQLNNQIGTSGTSANPGTINYSLNQLQTQYTSQVKSLLSQWNSAQSSIMLADSQLTNLQSMQSLTNSQSYQTGMMLGG